MFLNTKKILAMKKFDKLKEHKQTGNQKDFNEVLNSYLPKLEKYIKHRIRFYEIKKKLPVNFYSPADVLADVYLKIYEKFDDIKDEKQLKVELFKTADEIIESYVKKENAIKKKMPVDKILKEELNILKEELTADADGEIILVSDLTDEDIEYMQKEFKPRTYLFDFDAQAAFAESLGLSPEDFQDEKMRAMFGSIYGQLPEFVRRILDLNSLGGLSYGEIAEITGVKPEEVEEIIVAIKDKVKK